MILPSAFPRLTPEACEVVPSNHHGRGESVLGAPIADEIQREGSIPGVALTRLLDVPLLRHDVFPHQAAVCFALKLTWSSRAGIRLVASPKGINDLRFRVAA